MRARRYKLVKRVMAEHVRTLGTEIGYRSAKQHLEQFSDDEIEEELKLVAALPNYVFP